MDRKSVTLILFLTLVWLVLSEGFSLSAATTGLIVGTAAVLLHRKYIPLTPIWGVKLFKLVLYPFYLIGQIYLAGFQAIRLVLFGSKVEILDIKTNISSDLMRVALVNSITLIPGTISLNLNGDTITLLWMRKKELPPDTNVGDLIKGNLEKRIIKAER